MSLSLGCSDPNSSSLMTGCRLTVAFAEEKLKFRESLRSAACRGAALFLLSPCHGLRTFGKPFNIYIRHLEGFTGQTRYNSANR